MIDIVLSKVPFPYGKSNSIIMHAPIPTSVTWETIFGFIEKRTNIPRTFFSGTNAKGQKIYGGREPYPPWIYDEYRLRDVNGRTVATAFINIHFAPWCESVK